MTCRSRYSLPRRGASPASFTRQSEVCRQATGDFWAPNGGAGVAWGLSSPVGAGNGGRAACDGASPCTYAPAPFVSLGPLAWPAFVPHAEERPVVYKG